MVLIGALRLGLSRSAYVSSLTQPHQDGMVCDRVEVIENIDPQLVRDE